MPGPMILVMLCALVTAEAAPPPEGDVTIPAESLARLHLKFGQVTETRLSSELRVPGTVQSNGYREVKVTPLVGGVLTRVSAELGQLVKRGQPLAQVFSNDFAAAQMELIAMQAELEAEHKKLVRTQELVQLGAASREELETVQASHQSHEAHVAAGRQKLLLLGMTDPQINALHGGADLGSQLAIPAPINGMVVSRNANQGQVVAVGQELFTVTDLSSVWVEGSLFEKDTASVRVGSRAVITAPAYAGRVWRGAVSYIDPRVDAQTRTAKVRVVVNNPGLALRLGMYVDIAFHSASPARVLTVPPGAVQSIGSTQVVFVPAAEEGRFMQRTVRLGEETDAGVRVLEGLQAGEKVVTEGSFLVRAEALRQRGQ